jgi:RNA polymerase sigma-70 factor (ECF subfamily)
MMPNQKPAGSDPEAFTALYETYYKRVYQYMRYRCLSDQIAEDLTAQVFERILTHLQRYQPGEAPIEAWIFTIAANCFNDSYRRQKLLTWLNWDLFNHHPARQPGPEDQLVKNENHHELQEALIQLSFRERNIIACRFGARLSNRQIAAISKLSEQNVAVILFRALKKLKQGLESKQEAEHV